MRRRRHRENIVLAWIEDFAVVVAIVYWSASLLGVGP